LSSREKESNRDKDREDVLRSLSLLPPAVGQPTAAATPADSNATISSRLQRVFHLLQTSPAQLAEGGGAGGLVSPWGLLQLYLIEAVAEVTFVVDEVLIVRNS
jgi:hypothetical protein